MKTPSFAHEIGESALAGVGRNNMWISSIWNGFGKAWKHKVLHTKLENLHWQGWAGIICEYLLFEMASGSHESTKFCTKLENLHWQGWAGIIYVNIFYLKWLWEGMKTPSFAHEIGESALGRHGFGKAWKHQVLHTKLENLHWQGWARIMYVHIFTSIWNGFRKAWKHQVLHTKSENLPWQGWAGIIYVNIFYLKWLWEGMKTPSFAHEIAESALAGVGRNWAGIMWISSIWKALGKHLHTKLRNNVCEYLLFEMALGRHENTKFCTQNWRICTGRGGQE